MRCLGTMSSYKSTMNFRRVVNVLSFLHGWIYAIIKMWNLHHTHLFHTFNTKQVLVFKCTFHFLASVQIFRLGESYWDYTCTRIISLYRIYTNIVNRYVLYLFIPYSCWTVLVYKFRYEARIGVIARWLESCHMCRTHVWNVSNSLWKKSESLRSQRTITNLLILFIPNCLRRTYHSYIMLL